MDNISLKKKMVLYNQVIPSFVSVGLKFISGFGLFFLIGKTVPEESFSSYVVMLSIATFVSSGMNFGFSLKLSIDFFNNGICRAIFESYIIRVIILTIVLTGLFIVSKFIVIPLLFFWLLMSLYLGYMLESTSIKLRYKSQFWLEILFVFLSTSVPVFVSGYLLMQGESVEYIFFVNVIVKLMLFVPLFCDSLFRERINPDNLSHNFQETIKFFFDSVLVNMQPFFQIQLANIFLVPLSLGFFAYGQKIIQGFSTLFVAINNVFFPKIVKAKGDKVRTKYLLKMYLLIVNIVPIFFMLLLIFQGTSGLSLFINTIYEEFFFNIYIVLLIVVFRFNAGVIGSALSANGLQKLRVRINFGLMCTEAIAIYMVLNLVQTPTVLFLTILLSSFSTFILYMWVLKHA